MDIHVGNYVEVCCKEDGYLGSYFSVKVLAKVGKDRFKVEYQTLLSDEDESQKLKEVVHASNLRPCPPKISVPGFHVLEKVDAYDLDGWWVGRVTGRVGDTYFVYFDSSGDEFEYPAHKLRVHQEWADGNWVPFKTRGTGSAA